MPSEPRLKFTKTELTQLMTYCMWAEGSGTYYGNKEQFENRHAAIIVKLGAMQRQERKS